MYNVRLSLSSCESLLPQFVLCRMQVFFTESHIILKVGEEEAFLANPRRLISQPLNCKETQEDTFSVGENERLPKTTRKGHPNFLFLRKKLTQTTRKKWPFQRPHDF